MKDLDKKCKEIKVVPKYIIARFMKQKTAFKIKHFEPVLCYFGILDTDGQLHIHVRFDGRDEWNKLEDTLDIDMYFPKEEIRKIRGLLGDAQ